MSNSAPPLGVKILYFVGVPTYAYIGLFSELDELSWPKPLHFYHYQGHPLNFNVKTRIIWKSVSFTQFSRIFQ